MKLLASLLALTLIAGAGAADARGCLKGAAIGGVAGHFAHHHALLGAAAGCAIGHHYAAKHDREMKRNQHG
jgi:heme O synthase-like polyprenyltransferase